MSLTVDLAPEIEAALREEARQSGLKPEELAADYVQHQLNVTEWMRRLRAWSESHDRSIPPLSDYAVSRESFYEDHL